MLRIYYLRNKAEIKLFLRIYCSKKHFFKERPSYCGFICISLGWTGRNFDFDKIDNYPLGSIMAHSTSNKRAYPLNKAAIKAKIRSYYSFSAYLHLFCSLAPIFNIMDVEYAVIKNDGKLSALLKSNKQPATSADMGIGVGYKDRNRVGNMALNK